MVKYIDFTGVSIGYLSFVCQYFGIEALAHGMYFRRLVKSHEKVMKF